MGSRARRTNVKKNYTIKQCEKTIKNLKSIIRNNGVPQTILCDMSGVSSNTLYCWYSGKSIPLMSSVIKIMDCLIELGVEEETTEKSFDAVEAMQIIKSLAPHADLYRKYMISLSSLRTWQSEGMSPRLDHMVLLDEHFEELKEYKKI